MSERHLSLEEDYPLVSQYAKEMLVSQKLSGLIQKWREHVPIENRLEQFKNLEDAPAGEETQGDTSSNNKH